MATSTEGRNVLLSAQVPRDIRDWLERQAIAENRSLSSVVRRHLQPAHEDTAKEETDVSKEG